MPELNKKDFALVSVIGALVGLLTQPILANLFQDVNRIVPLELAPARVIVFFAFLILAPSALFAALLIARGIPVAYQFAKFAAVGTLNSFVDFGVLNLLIAVFGAAAGLPFTAFKSVSFLAATTNSYFWNKHWTFHATNQSNAGEVASFYGIAIAGGIINVGVASLVVNGMGAPEGVSLALWANVGALAGIFSALLWNFVGYKYFVFTKSQSA